MRRIIQKVKVRMNKISYGIKLLNWARTHSKEVKNYAFLIELRKVAYDKMLEMGRENNTDKATQLEVQVKLIDKILKYASHR